MSVSEGNKELNDSTTTSKMDVGLPRVSPLTAAIADSMESDEHFMTPDRAVTILQDWRRRVKREQRLHSSLRHSPMSAGNGPEDSTPAVMIIGRFLTTFRELSSFHECQQLLSSETWLTAVSSFLRPLPRQMWSLPRDILVASNTPSQTSSVPPGKYVIVNLRAVAKRLTNALMITNWSQECFVSVEFTPETTPTSTMTSVTAGALPSSEELQLKQLERNCFLAARCFTRYFTRLVSLAIETSEKKQCNSEWRNAILGLNTSFSWFVRCFEAWKACDTQRLIRSLENSFIDCYVAYTAAAVNSMRHALPVDSGEASTTNIKTPEEEEAAIRLLLAAEARLGRVQEMYLGVMGPKDGIPRLEELSATVEASNPLYVELRDARLRQMAQKPSSRQRTASGETRATSSPSPPPPPMVAVSPSHVLANPKHLSTADQTSIPSQQSAVSPLSQTESQAVKYLSSLSSLSGQDAERLTYELMIDPSYRLPPIPSDLWTPQLAQSVEKSSVETSEERLARELRELETPKEKQTREQNETKTAMIKKVAVDLRQKLLSVMGDRFVSGVRRPNLRYPVEIRDGMIVGVRLLSPGLSGEKKDKIPCSTGLVKRVYVGSTTPSRKDHQNEIEGENITSDVKKNEEVSAKLVLDEACNALREANLIPMEDGSMRWDNGQVPSDALEAAQSALTRAMTSVSLEVEFFCDGITVTTVSLDQIVCLENEHLGRGEDAFASVVEDVIRQIASLTPSRTSSVVTDLLTTIHSISAFAPPTSSSSTDANPVTTADDILRLTALKLRVREQRVSGEFLEALLGFFFQRVMALHNPARIPACEKWWKHFCDALNCHVSVLPNLTLPVLRWNDNSNNPASGPVTNDVIGATVLSAVNSKVQVLVPALSPPTLPFVNSSATVTYDWEARWWLLPVFFEHLSALISEIQRDSAEWFVASLPTLLAAPVNPSSQQSSLIVGISLLRRHFQDRLSRREVGLSATTAAFERVIRPTQLGGFASLGISGPNSLFKGGWDETKRELEASDWLSKANIANTQLTLQTLASLHNSPSSEIVTGIVAMAFTSLLALPHLLDGPSSGHQGGGHLPGYESISLVPETLAFDTKRLGEIRRLCDNLALEAALAMLARQLLRSYDVAARQTDENEFQCRLDVLLQEDDVSAETLTLEVSRYINYALFKHQTPPARAVPTTTPAAASSPNTIGDDASPSSMLSVLARAGVSSSSNTSRVNSVELEQKINRLVHDVLAEGSAVKTLFTRRLLLLVLRSCLGVPVDAKLASWSLNSAGLEQNIRRLEGLCQRLFRHTMSVHGELYGLLISEIAGRYVSVDK